MSENSRRDFLRKLGIGAAVVAAPAALGACLPGSGGTGGGNINIIN